MKKTIAILFVFVMPFSVLLAQELPKWAENARKAVFSIVTYTKDGQILSTGNGFYIDEQGTGVSDYSLFKGAERAIIITANGKELPVKYMMGANDMYDVVKFKTDFDKKAEALQPATLPSSTGETVYLVPYSTQKSSKGQTGTIAKVDTIGEQQYYYTLTMQTTEKTVSCPIMNAAGQVVGMIQKNNDSESKESFAIGIRYLTDLTINALSVNDLALNSIGIKKGLPEDESQALVYLYMASGVYAPNQYFDLLNDFISQYPNNMEGYLRRATYYINIGDDTHYALAVEDLKKMLDVAEKKDEAHYNIAKLIYSYQLNIGDKKPYASWTFDYALNEINEALAITQEPIYYQLQGDIYFAMQKFTEAYTAYDKVNKSKLASAATFYSAAKAKELIEGTDKKEVIALMDSAIAFYPKPYGKDAAPYLYERARIKSDMEDYRGAVTDYNDFYDAMLGQTSAEFHLIRSQAELNCRMYQQAINDINKAVELDPNNVTYWVEKGGIHIRVNQAAEAIQALTRAIKMDPENAPAYRMLGYAQIQNKEKDKGLANLQKAKDLGDEVADGLLQKYK
ncbi:MULTISPECIES: serine protease [Bacteroidaceae]|uniref:Tetratricopeptide repeat protein n=1 Tax=Phocaeicola intestinalis TaxID=2762212 RepID=A0ABR8YCF9_9BACT|nr:MULTISPECIES: serine protease [Bacteroidaceae]MBD8041896.1 tetratricopeptide repeat protein [Phocaeicola intestinalis]MBM6719197.1 tetratricopeptide repeat protein [Bacteroides gallinaceum]MBM6944357.1 tetratricopeptide repeat protein [Bacteroides gallinaceum]OUN80070.1 serine protease [Bacteroides sp. An51A]OUO59705.1 serine protease [Bacteroides sp. An279]